MDKMLFQFTRIGFCDDIHTKQRRANNFPSQTPLEICDFTEKLTHCLKVAGYFSSYL